MQATYPSVAGGVYTFEAQFGTAVATFAWNEWCIDSISGGAAGTVVGTGSSGTSTMLNRGLLTGLGTKTSGVTWTATATVTVS